MILSALIRCLPFILTKWQIAGIGGALYMLAALLVNDDIVRVHGPPAFFLAGDSTTAAQSCCGGGWGNGFLTTLHNHALGTNFGHNGATTVSFVADGDWGNVLESVSRYSRDYTPYVTIQLILETRFGHNDQKVISLDEYTTNLKNLALDVQTAGGYPILVTPLSRRNYNASGLITESLAPQRLATLSVAASLPAFVIDLNLASTMYLNQIGKGDALLYNLVPADNTHLNAAGSLVFGNMVSGLIGRAVRSAHGYDIDGYTHPNETIWDAIVAGEFILPTV